MASRCHPTRGVESQENQQTVDYHEHVAEGERSKNLQAIRIRNHPNNIKTTYAHRDHDISYGIQFIWRNYAVRYRGAATELHCERKNLCISYNNFANLIVMFLPLDASSKSPFQISANAIFDSI